MSGHGQISVRKNLDCSLAEPVIGQHEKSHCLDHGNSSRQHTGVVAALGFEGDGVSIAVDGLLRPADGCRGFEGHAEFKRFAVAD